MGFIELKNFLKNTKVYLAYPFFFKKRSKKSRCGFAKGKIFPEKFSEILNIPI